MPCLLLLAKEPVLALGGEGLVGGGGSVVDGLLVAGLASQFAGGLVVLEGVSGTATAGVGGA